MLCCAGLSNILHALEREHSKYEHVTYYPVAVAANDATGEAFVGVAWEYKALDGSAKDRWAARSWCGSLLCTTCTPVGCPLGNNAPKPGPSWRPSGPSQHVWALLV